VARRTLVRLVVVIRVGQELLHSLRVGSKHFSNVGLRLRSLAEPPNGIDRVFGSNFPLIDPFNGRREFGWIEPIEVLSEKKTNLIA
jgi:hypothetical protein